ncbi:MAG: 30S ribosomal protein S9 [Candidatus Schekmanbacteria bacterium RBG_13_48_7]|uniref:Small ribosomal subunit protein uS9 n=1 Tax=Candidatus Schekmanbacteria bacterium RBG_13_48_7 TaxID=1817878 RepID=A0A1F7RSN1_9BACT|nr:MAG: 30S ribosomal protein S9 [Candidatus Schekmanbacteria bacterium RBG_13_48_7]
MEAKQYHGTGKRKTSIARVYLRPGMGNIIINKRDLDDYFPRETQRVALKRPLELTGMEGKFEIKINVRGGGIVGQADAIRHGITKALLQYNQAFRPVLKRAGLITRDSRIKERKKYGQRGARARFQFSKR